MKEVSHRDDIQGLRGVAVLAVILFHVNRDWLPGGFVGVDIFLVISGFLITSIVLRQQRENSFTLLSFYGARIRRIVPAYLVLLAVVSLAMAVLLIPQDFNGYEKSLLAALYFNSNHFFANTYDYFAPANHEQPLLHTWSLAVEMQFYLLLPALLVFIPRRLLGPVFLATVMSILAYSSFRIVQGHRETEYFSLLARIPEFLLGSLLALQPARQNGGGRASNFTGALGLALVLWSFWFIGEQTAFPGLSVLAPCVGAVLLIAAGGGAVSRLISTRGLAWIGDLSYSLYLWHWPVLAGLRYFLGTYDLSVPALFGFAALTLACSYASYRYIELPFRRRRSGAGLIRIPALAAGALIAAWIAHFTNPRLVDPMPLALTRYAEPAEICHDKIVGDCVRGDKASSRTMLLLGDSHAAQLNYFADALGNSLPARIRVISASSCVPIRGFDIERIAIQARPSCLAQTEKASTYAGSSDAVIIAGYWQFHSGSPLFMEALDRFITEAASMNRTVIVLAQVPPLPSEVQRAYRLESLGLPAPPPDKTLRAEWQSANDRIRKLAGAHGNAAFLNLADDKFFADAPFENGVLTYRSRHYLNEVGSHRYGLAASPHFARLIGDISRAD